MAVAQHMDAGRDDGRRGRMNHINVDTVTDVVKYTDGWSVEDINGEAHLGDMGGSCGF